MFDKALKAFKVGTRGMDEKMIEIYFMTCC